ncbi:putative secreted protein (Por secretion system target) [Dyadobacter jiangsuensis]|uniref:Putative secreted protein (Por secretion system target) n=2 Tax=Dyadobacter jiangsuensis TaxID=1591085 RepID=A0A2P8FRH2_9BACT|nr:putative secreted protein (Por secretion system target) [Dyadobacter jiangsuensis]
MCPTPTCIPNMKRTDDLKREVTISPNPARDEVRISGMSRMEVATIVAWTRSGQAISLKEKQNGTVDVSHLKRGLYSLVITCWDGSMISKRISIRK